MSTDPTMSKEAWLSHVLEVRNKVWQSHQEEESRLAHVVLFLREDPLALPGKVYTPRAQHVFAGDFYDGPEAAIPIEDFKEAWARMITCTSIAGLGIASIIYQEAWHLTLGPGEKPPNDFSKDPRAIEHLIFRAEHLEYGCNWWTAKIHHVDGKRSMDEWETHDGALGGRLFEFLPRRKPGYMHRMVAREMLERLKSSEEASDG